MARLLKGAPGKATVGKRAVLVQGAASLRSSSFYTHVHFYLGLSLLPGAWATAEKCSAVPIQKCSAPTQKPATVRVAQGPC
jgi:hypothetical protein